MANRIERPDELKDCLVEAACAARSVMLRDHIVPERIHRVGEFITSLRRSLMLYGGTDQHSISKLIVDKCVWTDVLQLKGDIKTKGWSDEYINKDYMNEIEGIVGLAVDEMNESNPKMIENNLNDMSKQLDSLDTCINRVRNLNVEASEVARDFEKLVKEMVS